MTDITFVAVILSYFMVIWFKTNAFVEYMTVFRLTRLFHIAEYNQLHRDGYEGSYLDFLSEYYKDSFFVRLLSCPICFSFWLGVICSLYGDKDSVVLVAPLVLFFYLIFNKLL